MLLDGRTGSCVHPFLSLSCFSLSGVSQLRASQPWTVEDGILPANLRQHITPFHVASGTGGWPTSLKHGIAVKIRPDVFHTPHFLSLSLGQPDIHAPRSRWLCDRSVGFGSSRGREWFLLVDRMLGSSIRLGTPLTVCQHVHYSILS